MEPLHKERLFHVQSPRCIFFKVPRKEPPPPSEFCLWSHCIQKYVLSPELSSCTFSKFPEKEHPSRFPSQVTIERDALFQEPSSVYLSKSLVKDPPLQVPYRGPYGERCSSPGSSSHISQSSQ
jgi:hypothetical protein